MSTKHCAYTVIEVKPTSVGSSESNEDQELKGDGNEGQWEKGAESSHQEESETDSLWVIQTNKGHTHIQFCDIVRNGPSPDSEIFDPSIPATDASVFTQLPPPGAEEVNLIQRFTDQLPNWLGDREMGTVDLNDYISQAPEWSALSIVPQPKGMRATGEGSHVFVRVDREVLE